MACYGWCLIWFSLVCYLLDYRLHQGTFATRVSTCSLFSIRPANRNKWKGDEWRFHMRVSLVSCSLSEKRAPTKSTAAVVSTGSALLVWMNVAKVKFPSMADILLTALKKPYPVALKREKNSKSIYVQNNTDKICIYMH